MPADVEAPDASLASAVPGASDTAMPSRTRRLARLGIACGGGALLGLSLPPLGSWPLGIIGAGLIVGALRRQRLRARLLLGLVAGIGQFSIALAWSLQFSSPGYIALVLVESLILAIGLGLVPASSWCLAPGAASAVALAEWARDSWPFGGLPLGSAALGQMGGPLAWSARIGGPILVIWLLVLTGGAFAELIVAGTAGRPRLASLLGAPLVNLAAAVAVVVAGANIPLATPDRTLSVALIQGGGERGLTALQVPPGDVLRAAVKETTAVKSRPALILWPEDVVAMGSTPFVGSTTERTLAAIARSHHATLLAGVTVDVGATRFKNEIVALSPTGRLESTFEKVHRVPFGEYVPWRGFFAHLANLSAVPRDAIPGHGSGLLRTTAAPLAVLVSYEVFFADRGRSGVRAGGQLIVVPTNTSSYSNDQAPAQEIAASRLQAIEEDRYVLQAAPTGYTAVVSPSGTVEQRTSLSVPAVIAARVGLVSGLTPFGDAGELPILLVSLAILAVGWGDEVRRARGRLRARPA